jgi:hypothetical protein
MVQILLSIPGGHKAVLLLLLLLVDMNPRQSITLLFLPLLLHIFLETFMKPKTARYVFKIFIDLIELENRERRWRQRFETEFKRSSKKLKSRGGAIF